MKRLLIAAAIATAVFSLYGCSKTEDNAAPAATSTDNAAPAATGGAMDGAAPAAGAPATGAAPATTGAETH